MTDYKTVIWAYTIATVKSSLVPEQILVIFVHNEVCEAL